MVAKRSGVIIPTLLSRLQGEGAQSETNDSDKTFQNFLKSNHADRMALIADFAKKKDLDWLHNIQRGLSEYVKVSRLTLDQKRSILLVDSLLQKRGSSNKMLLEELALSLPVGLKSMK